MVLKPSAHLHHVHHPHHLHDEFKLGEQLTLTHVTLISVSCSGFLVFCRQSSDSGQEMFFFCGRGCGVLSGHADFNNPATSCCFS